MKDNNRISDVFQGSLLVEEARPEKGFFIKSKKRCFSLRDDKWHSKFSWEPVVVSDLWADETDGKCQMHFRVRMADGTRFQVDRSCRPRLSTGWKIPSGASSCARRRRSAVSQRVCPPVSTGMKAEELCDLLNERLKR